MRSWWRFCLVWLMVLAVPMQGMAGVAMQHCARSAGQTDHAAVVEAPHAHTPTQRPVHRHDAADPAAAAQASGHVQGANSVSTDQAGAAGGHVKALAAEGGHHCSACAACCAALGMPTWVTPLPLPTVAAATDPLPLVTIQSFVPAGLDRPPRIPLA
jgi:hypothetical protein